MAIGELVTEDKATEELEDFHPRIHAKEGTCRQGGIDHGDRSSTWSQSSGSKKRGFMKRLVKEAWAPPSPHLGAEAGRVGPTGVPTGAGVVTW